ncbi:MAG: preprotein translocase subunit SecE [Oscillospiraceae bacterium]|nr:preprotein translocase subunit SecE [Oscillospiraceae bacterium]
MKTLRNIFRILTLVFSVGAIVLFFTSFATVTSNGNEVTLIGAQLALGSKITTVIGETIKMARSADILFCFLLTIVSVITAALNFKFKGSRLINIAFSVIPGIYMLVIALSNPMLFVDTRPLENVTGAVYALSVILTAIALLLATVSGVVYVLAADYIEVMASKGEKLTIPKRIIRFLREYKSEVKKIVWPRPRFVVKNTVVVLIMCLIVGAFIWLLDFGLGNLINLILGVNK